MYKSCSSVNNLTMSELGEEVNICKEAQKSEHIRHYDVSIDYIDVKKNKKSELKEDFYKYMSLNSKFNCVYCLLFLFYPIHLCNQYKSDYFCSSIFNSQFSQYYKIYFEVFLGESVRTCSNILYILITINRYMLIGREHSPFLERISKLDRTRVVQVALLVSLCLNIGHIFQYQINGQGVVLAETHEYTYGTESLTYPFLAKSDLFFQSIQCYVSFWITWPFFLFNTMVEIIFVRKLKQEIKEKRNRI